MDHGAWAILANGRSSEHRWFVVLRCVTNPVATQRMPRLDFRPGDPRVTW